MPLPEAKQNKVRRQTILDCALELFVTKGYMNTTIRDIIEQSGMGTGTFYNYFTDKEDVLQTLLEEFAGLIMQRINSYYIAEDDLTTRFIETKRITMELFAENEKLSDLYSRVAGTSERIDRCLQVFEDKLFEFYRRNIQYGIRKGAFRDISVPPVAYSILATEKYLLYKWVVLKAISKEEMIEMVVSFHQTMAAGLILEK